MVIEENNAVAGRCAVGDVCRYHDDAADGDGLSVAVLRRVFINEVAHVA